MAQNQELELPPLRICKRHRKFTGVESSELGLLEVYRQNAVLAECENGVYVGDLTCGLVQHETVRLFRWKAS